MNTDIHYRRCTVDGVEIFYREAGDPSAPTLVLLHGFPTSSHMFRDLIPRLADRFHLVAPDYPGFGYSAQPSPSTFAYTFDRLADVIDQFLRMLGLARYSLYMQDFGGPVGMRIAARHPDRVQALVVQNANAYSDGLSAAVREIVLPPYANRTPENEAALRKLFERPVTEAQFLDGVPDPSLVSPDAIEHAQWGLDRPGNKAIQLEIHANYGSNVEHYDGWHAYLRAHQPPMLVAWGKGDRIFLAPGAEAYRRDLPYAEIHMLDAGHFALETHSREIAALVAEFLQRVVR